MMMIMMMNVHSMPFYPLVGSVHLLRLSCHLYFIAVIGKILG